MAVLLPEANVQLETDLDANGKKITNADLSAYAGTNLTWTGTQFNATGGGGSGNVVGPAGASNNDLVRFDGATGLLIKAMPSSSTYANFTDTGELDIFRQDGVTNAPSPILTLNHTTTGTQAAGIGARMEFTAQTGDRTNDEIIRVDGATTNVGAGTVASYLGIWAKNASTLTELFRLWGSGALSVNNTTDPGAGWVNVTSGYKINNSQIAFSNIAGTATNGQLPSTISGKTYSGGGFIDNSNVIQVQDSQFTVQDDGDNTKQLQFQCSSIATGVTRTATVPDADCVLVKPDTGASNNFLTAVSAVGVISKAQPSFSNLSGNPTGGQLNLSTTSPITGGGTTTIGLNVGVDFVFSHQESIIVTGAGTNTTQPLLVVEAHSSGTAANGFGAGINLNMQSASGSPRPAAQINAAWSDATDVTRTAYIDFQTTNSTTTASAMRLFGSKGLAVGSTTDPGAGIVAANTGYWVGTAASTSGKILKSNGSQFQASTETYAAPGTANNVMTSDGTNWTSAAPTTGTLDDTIVLAEQALGGGMKAQTVGSTYLGLSSSAFTLVNQQLQFVAVYLQKSGTITGVKWYQSTNGNYTANNNNKVGLYTYSGGTLTQVAASTTNANLWQQGASAIRSQAFSATYSAAAGLFFVAFIYCNSAQTTAPTMAFSSIGLSSNLVIQDFTNSGKLNGTVATQTDLPATQASSGITASSSVPWVFIY